MDDLTRDTLLRSRKLSLIVDLDQTIIHTTVDPTVGEWMADIAEDERPDSPDPEEHVDGATSTSNEANGEGGGTTTPPGSPRRKPARRKREPNPNAEALRDVARFQLSDDPPPNESRRKGKLPERWYYTKPRSAISASCSWSASILADISDLDSTTSWIQCRNTTRCTSTPWARGLMRMRSVE